MVVGVLRFKTDAILRLLRAKGEPIEGIEDFLFRYCEPEPLTEEGFPIYMLKTKAPNSSASSLRMGAVLSTLPVPAPAVSILLP